MARQRKIWLVWGLGIAPAACLPLIMAALALIAARGDSTEPVHPATLAAATSNTSSKLAATTATTAPAARPITFAAATSTSTKTVAAAGAQATTATVAAAASATSASKSATLAVAKITTPTPTPAASNAATSVTTVAVAHHDDDPLTLAGDKLKFASDTFSDRCSMCHEIDGDSADPRMNLIDATWNHGGELADIAHTISEGVPGTKMKGQKGKFTPEQINDLAKYVKLLSHKKMLQAEDSSREETTALTNQVTEHLPEAAPVPPVQVAKVEIPDNFIDERIFGKMKADGIPHAPVCTDAEFVRRIYLDLWGRLPDPDQVRKFVADTDKEKRNKLIDNLLCLDYMQRPGPNSDYKGPWLVDNAFLSKWTNFFCDLYRTGDVATYVRLCLLYDLPYDFWVKQMLTETAVSRDVSGPAGYLLRCQVDGIRCADIMHEDTCDEIAVNSTKVFLGISLECISCHDGARHLDKTNLWLSQRKRVEFWRQAAFFGNLRVIRGSLVGNPFTLLDGPALRPEAIWQGQIASPEDFNKHFPFTSPLTKFGGLGYRMEAPSVLRVKRDRNAKVYPEFLLTKEQPKPDENPRVAYARMVTGSFQFAKVIANLIWSKFMTVGIVDPPLDWDLARQDPKNPPPAPWTIQPSHPELLDDLGHFVQQNNFDLRLLMRQICRSQAYQLSSRFDGEYKPEYDRYYARKLVRRLSAEEIYDALCKATNVFGNGVTFAMDANGPPGDPDIKRFLDFFGQSNRLTKQPQTKSSIVQASLMLNSNLVKKKVLSTVEGSTLNKLVNNPSLTNEQIVDELFLATLSRFPTDEEKAESVKHIERYRNKGAEDVQWALINKLEFITNY